MIRSLARQRRIIRSLGLTLTLIFAAAFLPAPPAAQRATGSAASAQEPQVPVIAPGSAYRQTNLVTDAPGLAPVLDPLLVNPWGISLTGTSPFWVANAGTATSTLYRGDVGGAPLVPNPGLRSIDIPPTPPPPPGSLPTGTVANTTNDFVITSGSASGPARFLFATITGKIMGWNPNVPTAGSATAVEAAAPPPSPAPHVYLGLAIGNNGSGNFLYAADAANNNIDVFNSSFALQPEASFPFTDPTAGAGALPADYVVHNIQALGGELYVTYARVDMSGNYIRPGGAVNVFDFNGVFKRRIHLDGPLSAPWGLALTPGDFGTGVPAGTLLVGNFTFEDGNGRINAFNATTGAHIKHLQNEAGQPISIDGLWGLQFGNGVAGGDANTLYFAAGIGHEEHGLFGKINPTTATATSLIQFATDDFAIGEGAGHIDVTVVRAGDASNPATVNYSTFDESQPDHANQKSDYEIALGTLSFAAGETSKTFRLLIVNDALDENNEVVEIKLSNPTGTGVGLGSPNEVRVTIIDNDTGTSTTNPIDDPAFFVRQHYLDFLNREPDESGFTFWTNQMTNCGNPNLEVCRVNVSAAFFLSIEFQRTGVLAYATHRAAFGPNAPGSPAPVLYGNFMRDVQALQRGLVFGQPGFDAQLEANKVAYFNEFVTRPEFVAKYPSTLSNADYVDALLKSANLSPDDFIVNMTNSQEPGSIVPTTTGGAPRPASYGTARFVFNSGRTALTMSGTVNNIDFTGSQTTDTNDNLTNAHIHASSADPPPATRPVVFGFIGTPFNDNNPNDAVVTPFASGVGGTFSAKWDAPEGQNTTLAAQLDNLLAGRAYINFHTVQFGGGEVRGNFPALQAFRDSLVAGLNGGTLTRAGVLRMVAESEFLQARERNATFVTMEYFGYLRRDPDTPGFNFWLGKLNEFQGNFVRAEMVKAFITSAEYRQRFGPS